jgi:exopolysaccharide production protein ExoQ
MFAFISTAVNFLAAIAVELALRTFQPGLSEYRFAGTQHPNLLAMCLAVLTVSSIAMYDYFKTSRILLIFIVGASLFFLFLTKSRISLISAIFSFLAYAFVRSQRKLVLPLLFLALSGILAIFLVLTDDFSRVLSLGRPTNEIGTLTDRLPLWGNLLNFAFKEPLLGYGFNAFWTEPHIYRIENLRGWIVLHSHNTFFELLLGVGLIGLVLYVVFVALSTVRAYRLAMTEHPGFYAFLFAILVFYWTVMPVESMLFKFTLPNFICFTVMLRLAFFEKKTSAASTPQNMDQTYV